MVVWTMDMIRLRVAPRHHAIDNADLADQLYTTAQKFNLADLFKFLDRLHAARKMLLGQVNRQLLLEEILILWMRQAHPKT